MKFELVLLQQLSGRYAGVYTVKIDSGKNNLLEQFVLENKVEFRDEVADILQTLAIIGDKHGAREQYFKLYEGRYGDCVCALYDNPDRELRLYCIRFGVGLVVVGSGGHKPEGTRAWQDDEKLKKEAERMIAISAAIRSRIESGDLEITADGYDFEGDFIF